MRSKIVAQLTTGAHRRGDRCCLWLAELQDKAIKLVNAFRQSKLDTLCSAVKINLVTRGSTSSCRRIYAQSKAFGHLRNLYSCLRAEVSQFHYRDPR